MKSLIAKQTEVTENLKSGSISDPEKAPRFARILGTKHFVDYYEAIPYGILVVILLFLYFKKKNHLKKQLFLIQNGVLVNAEVFCIRRNSQFLGIKPWEVVHKFSDASG